jgi:hypothetical protein
LDLKPVFIQTASEMELVLLFCSSSIRIPPAIFFAPESTQTPDLVAKKTQATVVEFVQSYLSEMRFGRVNTSSKFLEIEHPVWSGN